MQHRNETIFNRLNLNNVQQSAQTSSDHSSENEMRKTKMTRLKYNSDISHDHFTEREDVDMDVIR